MRFGFADYRRRLLQEELTRILEELPNLNVKKVLLYGDLAVQKVGPTSNVQLVCIQETDAPFPSRIDFFYNHLHPRVGLDILVYTPREFQDMQHSSLFLQRVLAHGQVVYGS